MNVSTQLHGSVVLSGVRGSSKEGSSLGSLDYWIKLHTHDTKRVLRWMERRRARETLARLDKKDNLQLNRIPNNFLFIRAPASARLEASVSFLQGEKRQLAKANKEETDETEEEEVIEMHISKLEKLKILK